ncbi:pimeloyl-ACP methyl ester carboxylesterase [Sphingobium xenophagum]|uniref:Pimeloyl-ACP methyl ester carboxylesterase n=1 Tax=Sphingobium xenophagum TaxID=121428 RepID=A0ABU1X6T2_SPHXE|nr:alpha/beta fold hydrolase [Sphingobium xenophagum]MDR7157258.1 pimeloyl-ACP methyl ester carboxylesterase [Sphingobium xenophagum]
MTESVTPFRIDVPQEELDDLRHRLARTRWPDGAPVDDLSQGVPLTEMQSLCDYWATDYDWRRCERMLNGLGQYRTAIDGLGIHFLHIRSPEPDALPMIMTHGWPGSVLEFAKVIGPLTDPAAHGGDAKDAFHLVLPSLPGYGFSDRPVEQGWGPERTAAAWATLMQRLGYDRWVAQGGDWGSVVTRTLGAKKPEGCLGIHLNFAFVPPTAEDMANLTPQEQALLGKVKYYQDEGSGYAKQQSTRPQTIGYGLNDSPVGLAAWIYEKLQEWTDNDGKVEDTLTKDEILDNITLYWLTQSATSSARFYWENRVNPVGGDIVDLPTGITQFPGDIMNASRRWVERSFSGIIWWSEQTTGGHFAAWERPDIFAAEVQDCFRQLR